MTIAVALIIIGLLFVLAEVIFIPGTTFVGFIGAALSLLGIVKIYIEQGNLAGHIALGASLVVLGVLFVAILKFDIWSGVSLKDTISSKVNEDLVHDLHIGSTGVSKSVLRPVGKATFGDKEFEVQTLGHYVEEGVQIEIIQLHQSKIIVKPFES